MAAPKKTIAIGTNVFGWTVPEKEAGTLLDLFCDRGFKLVDTADVYGVWLGKPGLSEEIIGRWNKKPSNRNKIHIATKGGGNADSGGGLSKKNLRHSLERSLERLQTDYIDLYQCHAEDPITPIEETLDALELFKKEGKIGAHGLCNFSPSRLKAALDTAEGKNISSLQVQYNLLQNRESEALSICEELELAVYAYLPLAAGFLSGKYKTPEDIRGSPRSATLRHYSDERGFHILNKLKEIAIKENCSMAQLAIAWVMNHPAITAPMVSVTSPRQMEELCKVPTLSLNPESFKILDKIDAYSP